MYHSRQADEYTAPYPLHADVLRYKLHGRLDNVSRSMRELHRRWSR